MSHWIHGETGGYLRYSTERRNWFETDFPKFKAEATKPLSQHKRTTEHASYIVESVVASGVPTSDANSSVSSDWPREVSSPVPHSW